MPRQSAHGEHHRHHRRCAAGVSRPALAAVPELHHMPSEDPRKLRGQESFAMSRLPLAFVLMVVPLLAQAPEPQAPAEAASSPAAEAPSPVPPAESWLTGSIDVGYRLRTDVGGSFDTYRSIVNLGSGPKLLGADFTLTDPQHRAFDQIRVRAYSWGDEPYQTVHLDAK